MFLVLGVWWGGVVKGEGKRAFVQQVSWFGYPVDRIGG